MQSLYIQFGSLYSLNGIEIERPTILIDPEMDMIYAWGKFENISKKQIRFHNAGIETVAVELKHLPKNVTAYIILRMMNYTASGFIRNFYNHRNDIDTTWLLNEMDRLPIKIPNKE